MKKITKSTYKKLRQKIRQEIRKGSKNIQDAYRRQVLVTHWNIGKILTEYIPFTEKPSSLNAAIIEKLERDFGKPETFFYAVMKLYRFYPTLPAQTFLTWTHYQLLISIEDEKERNRIEDKVIREKMNTKDLRVLVRTRGKILPVPNAHNAFSLPCKRGMLYHYRVLNNKRIVKRPGKLLVELGFNVERMLRVPKGKKIHSGLIVRAVKRERKGEDVFSIRIAQPKPERLYTYHATVEKSIDADTHDLRIDLGFLCLIEERIRLRGINAPEKTSAFGKKALAYVKKQLSKVGFVIIKTYKDEKYGRMLADLFYLPGEKDPAVVAAKGIFLNQELLDKGFAVPYSG